MYREAADKRAAALEAKPEENGTNSSAASSPLSSGSPLGMVMEVVIPVKPGHPAYEKVKNSGDDAPSKRKRRTTARAIIISDDDEPQSDSDYEEPNNNSNPPEPKPKKAPAGNGVKRKRIVDSDDEFSAEETDSDEPPPATSDDDESVVLVKPVGKGKKAGKKGSVPSSTTSADEDVMSVDEEPAKAKKVKATKDKVDDRPSKRQKRTDSDPWKLGSKAVKKDWTQMQAPPIEMFHFARKVIDEYTYLDGKVHSLITKLSAERKWVLSGTPPIHDFAALKTIAAFLNLHLGVDDDGEGQSQEVKKRRREQTGAQYTY
jgi:hypothetical protein